MLARGARACAHRRRARLAEGRPRRRGGRRPRDAREACWRGARIRRRDRDASAQALWRRATRSPGRLARSHSRPLGRWLQAFDALLLGAAQSAAGVTTPPAVQLRRALRLERPGRWRLAGMAGGAWRRRGRLDGVRRLGRTPRWSRPPSCRPLADDAQRSSSRRWRARCGAPFAALRVAGCRRATASGAADQTLARSTSALRRASACPNADQAAPRGAVVRAVAARCRA